MEKDNWKSKMLPGCPGNFGSFKNYLIEGNKKVFVGFDGMNQAIEVWEGTFEEDISLYFEKEGQDLTKYGLSFFDCDKSTVKKRLQEKLSKIGFNDDQINDIYQEFVDSFYN